MLKKILVSGADFRYTAGIISIFEISDSKISLLREIKFEHPFAEESEKGKGITGLVRDGDSGMFWANFSNVIVKIDIINEIIVDIISNDEFNDLHDLFLHNNSLISVNSGNESIDIIDCNSKLIRRIDFLGPDLRNRKPQTTMFSSTKPHLHHISSARYNDKNELIVGLFKQQRILNIDNWSQVGTKMESPVHDIQVFGDEVCWTTVCGKVFSSHDEKPVLDMRDICEQIGWIRGLYKDETHAIIGSTALRESNNHFYSILTGQNSLGAEAKIMMVDINNQKLVSEFVFPDSQFRKVYSIISLNQ